MAKRAWELASHTVHRFSTVENVPLTTVSQSAKFRRMAPRSLEVINPATLDVVDRVPLNTTADLDQMVRQASRAQPTWAAAADRPSRLRAIASSIETRAEELAQLLTREQGKPLTQARLEVGVAVRAFSFYADLDLDTEVLKDEPTQRVERHFHPLGVAGLITAWNFPIALFAWKASAALRAGNAVIIKPAPTTPLTALTLCSILADHLPDGLVHAVNGEADLGAALVEHPGVQKISFTGSTAVGRRIMNSGSALLKRLTLELGGNDPALILPDADIEQTVRGIAAVAFRNAGQVCIAPKRVLVPHAMQDEVVAAFTQFLNEQRIGDGMDEATTIGPVHSKAQYDSLTAFEQSATDDGGTLHFGPEPADLPGYFIRPGVVTGLRANAKLICEEQFGPLLPIIAYDTVDQAVDMANATEYGLGGSVWGADDDMLAHVASRLRSGTRWVNQHGPAEIDIPFGGIKQSGLGIELGREGLLAYTEARVTNIKRRTV